MTTPVTPPKLCDLCLWPTVNGDVLCPDCRESSDYYDNMTTAEWETELRRVLLELHGPEGGNSSGVHPVR